VTFIGAGLMFLAVIASKLNKINRQLTETERQRMIRPRADN
jgi:hypothetical protein